MSHMCSACLYDLSLLDWITIERNSPTLPHDHSQEQDQYTPKNPKVYRSCTAVAGGGTCSNFCSTSCVSGDVVK